MSKKEVSILDDMDFSKFIAVGDFCKIKTDKEVLSTHGLLKGHIVWVCNCEAIPIEPEEGEVFNPYIQQLVFAIHKTNKDNIVDPDSGIYLVAPESLEKLSEKNQKKLTEKFHQNFVPMTEGDIDHDDPEGPTAEESPTTH